MTLFTQERMMKLIDEIASGKSVAQASALAYGSRSKVAWVHFRNARRDRNAGMDMMASPYHLENWPDEGEHHWLDHAYEMAVQIAKLDFHHEVLAEIRQSTRPVLADGGVMYEKDPWLLAKFKDAEEAEFFGYEDWPYKHDEHGARIELRVRDRTSAALTIAGLKAEYGERWNVPEKIDVKKKTIKAVLTLGENKQPQQPSNMRMTMQEKLDYIRANPNRPSAKPSGPVDLGNGGRGAGDPPENVSNRLGDDSARTLPPEPPCALPPPQPVISYARRPNNNLDRQDAPDKGAAPPGGFKVR